MVDLMLTTITTYLRLFKGLSIPLQNIIVNLFMSLVRYVVFLESISKDYLDKQNCRNYDELHQTMGKFIPFSLQFWSIDLFQGFDLAVFVYILSYRVSSLFFEDSIDCFVHFKIRKIMCLVAYLLEGETSNIFHEKGCLIFEEDFVEQKLVLPLLEATPCLEVQFSCFIPSN